MNRRSLLAGAIAGATGVLAGCADPAGSLQLTAADGTELANEATFWQETPTDERGRLVARAVRNDTTTINDTSPPIDAELPVSVDGGYYNLSWSTVDERERRIYPIEIDYNPTDTAGEAIAYKDLPAVDRAALEDVIPPRRDQFHEGPDIGVSHHYDEQARDVSVLVPEQEYSFLTDEGERYRLLTRESRTQTEYTYRYTATEVAPDAESYATQLRERYRFRLGNLSTAERDVVEEAIEDGYYAEDTDDQPFRSLLERFRDEQAVTHDEWEGEWVVSYDGTTYWAEVYFGQFTGE
jgi:hypothetical protein